MNILRLLPAALALLPLHAAAGTPARPAGASAAASQKGLCFADLPKLVKITDVQLREEAGKPWVEVEFSNVSDYTMRISTETLTDWEQGAACSLTLGDKDLDLSGEPDEVSIPRHGTSRVRYGIQWVLDAREDEPDDGEDVATPAAPPARSALYDECDDSDAAEWLGCGDEEGDEGEEDDAWAYDDSEDECVEPDDEDSYEDVASDEADEADDEYSDAYFEQLEKKREAEAAEAARRAWAKGGTVYFCFPAQTWWADGKAYLNHNAEFAELIYTAER